MALAPPDAALVDKLVMANRILYRRGVVDGFGHVSVRHDKSPDHFLLSCNRAPGVVRRAVPARLAKAQLLELALQQLPAHGQRQRLLGPGGGVAVVGPGRGRFAIHTKMLAARTRSAVGRHLAGRATDPTMRVRGRSSPGRAARRSRQ